MDEALREKSGYTLPPKIHISQQDGDYYNVMPCIYKRGNLAMVKMIGYHGHENRIMDLFRQTRTCISSCATPMRRSSAALTW